MNNLYIDRQCKNITFQELIKLKLDRNYTNVRTVYNDRYILSIIWEGNIKDNFKVCVYNKIDNYYITSAFYQTEDKALQEFLCLKTSFGIEQSLANRFSNIIFE